MRGPLVRFCCGLAALALALAVGLPGGWRAPRPAHAEPAEPAAEPESDAAQVLRKRLQTTVTVSFTNTELRNVLNGLAKTYDLNLVANDKVQGTVNLTLKDVTLEEALTRILKLSGYAFRIEGSVLEVISLEEELVTEILPMRFVQPDVALEFLKGSSSEAGVMKSDESLNAILVTDLTSRIEKMKRILEKIDVPPRQVLIEARLLDVTHTDLDNLGLALSSTAFDVPLRGGGLQRLLNVASGSLNLGGPSADLTTDTLAATISRGPETITVTLDALIRDKRVKVLASPIVATLNNVEAKITIGEKFPIQETTQTTTGTLQTTRFVDVGITLRVTPKINRDGFIQMQIHPEVSSVSATLDQGPRITTREADTTVIIKEGESVVIAGLIQEDETSIADRFPFLGHIPFLGFFFSNRSKSYVQKELIVVITPRLLPVQPPQVARGSEAEEMRRRMGAMELFRQAEDFELGKSLQARQTPEAFRLMRSVELYEQMAEEFPASPFAPEGLWRAGHLRWTRLKDGFRAEEILTRLTVRYPDHPRVEWARRKIREIQSRAARKKKKQAQASGRASQPGFR